MKHNLTLVTLTPDQIWRAKEANGKRKQITHALICGPHGQLFGTEQQCLKYFSVWDPGYRMEVAPGKYESMFAILFDKAVRTDTYEIADYKSTWGLVEKLIEASETPRNEVEANCRPDVDRRGVASHQAKKRKGVFGWLFSRRRRL